MVRNQLSLLLVIFVLMVPVTSCQNNPVSPDTVGDTGITTGDRTTESAHRMNLGSYLIELDTENLTATPVPLRSSELHLNLTKIFVNTMGISLAIVPGESDPPNGLFAIDFTLTHPLGSHPEFSIFDVKGIVMAPGTLSIGSLKFSDTDETQLVNADGLTRWWNPAEFTDPGVFGYTDGLFTNTTAGNLTATLNPYKIFADVLGATDDLSALWNTNLLNNQGRGVFRDGSSNTRRYMLRFPMAPGPVIVFSYVIDGCWDFPDPNPPGAVPDDFPMVANQPEPYCIILAEKANSLYYDSESGTGGGVFRLQANVHDWQGHALGAVAPEIETVRIFSPGLLSGGETAVFLDDPGNKARYTADLTGAAIPTNAGEALIAVKAVSNGGPEYNQGGGTAAPDATVSAWQTMVVNIVDPDCIPDTNNQFNEAVIIDLSGPITEQLCATDDYKDFYKFTIEPGTIVTGTLTLFCDVAPTVIGLYDSSEVLIAETFVSGGTADLDMALLDNMPGIYYVRVLTQTSGQAFLYMIDPDVELQNTTPSNPVLVTPEGLYLRPDWTIADGDLFYTAGMSGFWVHDYANISSPNLVSYTEIFCDTRPVMDWPNIYYSSQNNISMINVTNPANPINYPQLITESFWIITMAVEPGYLYYCLESAEFEIYDIGTDPSSPAFVNTMFTTNQPHSMEIIFDSDSADTWLAISNTDSNVLEIYDVTNKSGITLFETILYTPGTRIVDIKTTDNHVYTLLINGTSYFLNSVSVDSAPGAVAKGTAILVNRPDKLTIEGGYAYVANTDESLSIVNLTYPDMPGYEDSYDLGNAPISDLDADGDTLVLARKAYGLHAFSIADPTVPVISNRIMGLSSPKRYTIEGNYLYCIESSNPYYAVKAVNIADPANAYVAADLSLPWHPQFLVMNGNRMVVADSNEDMFSIDCSDPLNMQILSTSNAGVFINAMSFSADAIYISHPDNSVSIWDTSSWPNLTNQGTFTLPDIGREFEYKGTAMYVRHTSGIEVMDVSNPLNPASITTYVTASQAQSFALDGDYMFITNTDVVEIVDISTPLSPALHLLIPEANDPFGSFITVANQHAIFQSKSVSQPSVLQLWPIDTPVMLGPLYSIDFAIMPSATFVHEGYYYEGVYYGALRIWDLY